MSGRPAKKRRKLTPAEQADVDRVRAAVATAVADPDFTTGDGRVSDENMAKLKEAFFIAPTGPTLVTCLDLDGKRGHKTHTYEAPCFSPGPCPVCLARAMREAMDAKLERLTGKAHTRFERYAADYPVDVLEEKFRKEAKVGSEMLSLLAAVVR